MEEIQKDKKSSLLPLWSLILGFIGLFIPFIPIIGFIGIQTQIIGLILGIKSINYPKGILAAVGIYLCIFGFIADVVQLLYQAGVYNYPLL